MRLLRWLLSDPCPACGERVSVRARVCPTCGAESPAARRARWNERKAQRWLPQAPPPPLRERDRSNVVRLRRRR